MVLAGMSTLPSIHKALGLIPSVGILTSTKIDAPPLHHTPSAGEEKNCVGRDMMT